MLVHCVALQQDGAYSIIDMLSARSCAALPCVILQTVSFSLIIVLLDAHHGLLGATIVQMF